VLGDQKPLPDRWQTLLPSSPILSNNFSPKSTPLTLNALHLYCMLAILDPQWQGGNTSPCHCEAGIPSLGAPPVKITPNRVKYSKLHSRWCNFPSLTRRVLHKARRCCPHQQDSPPLPKTPPDTPCAYDHFGGVCFALPPLRAPTKNSTIFRIIAHRSIPNCDSHFPSFEQRVLRR